MVIFKELQVDGFKKYNNKRNFQFEEGLMGIFGKNETGKSTIGDAISVSLFGVSSTHYNKADIITWGRSKSILILDFEVDKLYRVRRTIGKTKSTATLQIKNNEKWQTIENTIKSVDNRIQDILGLDFKSFKNSIFIGQNDLDALSSLTKQERQSIINRLSRYDELSKAEKQLKQKIKEIKHGLDLLEKDFVNLKKLVDDKEKKLEELKILEQEKSEKNDKLNVEKKQLTAILNEIRILDQLKIIKDTEEKIYSLNKLLKENDAQLLTIKSKEDEKKEITEKIIQLEYVNKDLKKNIEEIEKLISEIKDTENLQKEVKNYEDLIKEKIGQITIIEHKESQKEEFVLNLNKLSHVNKELFVNIEEIGSILSDIDKLKGSESELDNLEKLIKEKKSQINKIESKEREKEVLIVEFNDYSHITPELKNKIDKLSTTFSKLKKIRDVEIEKVRSNINKLQKNIEDSEKLINEKQKQLDDIISKESKISKIKTYLDDFAYLGSDLKSDIETMGITESNLKSCENEINRIEKEKELKSKFLDDEKRLKEDNELYSNYLELKNNLDKNTQEIYKTQSEIDLYKKELGDLDGESTNLSDIESNYETKINTANILVFSGVGIFIIGLILGFIINFLLILIALIGILPLYKGYNDKKVFNSKLNIIKEKREVFGYLKQLESQLTDLYNEYNYYEDELESYKDLDLESLKKNFNTYRNLEKEINDFNKLKNDESIVRAKINQYEIEINSIYNSLPTEYKNSIPLSHGTMYKSLFELYQAEDKEKSKYESKLTDLDAQISGKQDIQNEIDSYKREKAELEQELLEVNKSVKNLQENEIKLKNSLKEEYESLPPNYRDTVSLNNLKLDKLLLELYQREDKTKSNLDSKIKDLNKEINEKEGIKKDMDQLVKEKENLNDYSSNKTQELNSELRNSFDKLPDSYKINYSFDDSNLYKEILSKYQKEDRYKNTLETQIESLDKEILKRNNIEIERNRLIKNKNELEIKIYNDKKRLNNELNDKYEILPLHYRKISIDDLNLGKTLNNIYQSEDKEKSKFEDRIKNLDKDIAQKVAVQNKLKGLQEQKTKLKNELSEQNEQLKLLTDRKGLQYNKDHYANLIEQKNALNEKIKEIDQGIWSLTGDIRTLSKDTTDLDDKKEELENLKSEIENDEFEMDVNDIAKNEISFTAQSLREQVMDRTTKYVALFLPKITNNKYRDVKISEDFKIKVYSPEKNDFESINSLSGGAKDQVLFAFRLAFTHAIIGGRSRSKGFALFLDEFLGSFDHNRRTRTLKMLKELKDYFRQIFLISHIEGMEMDVDQIIKTPET
jgi:exonuclease SbcC